MECAFRWPDLGPRTEDLTVRELLDAAGGFRLEAMNRFYHGGYPCDTPEEFDDALLRLAQRLPEARSVLIESGFPTSEIIAEWEERMSRRWTIDVQVHHA